METGACEGAPPGLQAQPLEAAAPAVYPSGATVPENLLRMTLVFAERPSAVTFADIALHDGDRTPIEHAFLQQDLWSPDRKVLTLLLDPGRVKSGLIAGRELGPALVPGERVDVVFRGEAIKSWTVIDNGSRAPDPDKWKITIPADGTRDPLLVMLDTALDFHARDLIAVAGGEGNRIMGNARFAAGETEWRFTPDAPWEPGDYRLRVHSNAETPCGHRVSGMFERASSSGDELRIPSGTSFRIG